MGGRTTSLRSARADERAGLQALLRGAQEALARLPGDSLSLRSIRMLEAGLLEMLGDEDIHPGR
jgi:hypothetical protein